MSECSAVTKWHPVGGSMARVLVLVSMFALSGRALAEDDAQRRAREELDRQLNQLVEKAPSRVSVSFQPLDDPNLQVEELELSIDGRPLKSPTQAALSAWIQDGPMPVGALEVSPGRHKVNARATVHHTASPLVTEEGDHRWKLTGEVAFEVAAGIEVKVIVHPVRDAEQRDIAKRIKLVFPSQPVMIAKLDDGSMPEPTKVKPKPVVDAGVVVAAVVEPAKIDPAEEKRKKLEAAAEEKRLKLEAAAEAKRLAAEAKKRKAEEALEAKRAAAEEKKRKAEEALEAKRAAAEEKKRRAEEALEAKRVAAEDKKERVEALLEAKHAAEEVVDAGVAVAEVEPPVIDAGVVAAVVPIAPLPVAPETPPLAAEAPAEGPPWLILGGVVGAAALLVVIVLARRSSRVPKLDD